MKCVRNLRAGVIVIDPLKTNEEVLAIKKRSEERKLKYQIDCQADLSKYSQQELNYYKEHRFTILKCNLSTVAYAAAKERRTLRLNQAQIDPHQQEQVKTIQDMSTCELSFFTQTFILIGPACESIRKWGYFNSKEDMMKRMTKNFRCFERFEQMAPN